MENYFSGDYLFNSMICLRILLPIDYATYDNSFCFMRFWDKLFMLIYLLQ